MIGTDYLPADRERRLNEVLLTYLEADGLGEAPDQNWFLGQYPEFAHELADFFACRQRVESIVAPLRATSTPGCSSSEVGAFRNGFDDFAPRTQRRPMLPPTLPGLTNTGPRPCLLGDFRLFREIGRGGMGIVYEAEQISLNRRVALKVLPFAAGLDHKQLQRFKNEAQTAALLHHPNIVPVYAVGCEGGVHYFAMQFIAGRSLAAFIEEQRQEKGIKLSLLGSGGGAAASPSEAAPTPAAVSAVSQTPAPPTSPTVQQARNRAFLRGIAELGLRAAMALEHAHQHGVVHRDIKPANLLLDGRDELWITDFGLAMFQTGAGVTMTGELVGTLRYMSPEQALAKRGLVDHRTDIYSLGATLYELLTLEPIFPGKDGQELLCQIAYQEPRLPRAIDRTIPVDLETILLKAMMKNPSERYATAQELADDLQRFLEDKPIQARRPTAFDQAAKWARRHKALVAVGLGTLLLGTLGLVVSNVLIAREHGKAKAAYTREQQKAREAEDQRARAESNYRQARRAVDFFVELSNEVMLDKPHLLEVRMKLLEAALTYYQDFIDQHGDDPSIQAELADSRARAACILHALPSMQKCSHFELLASKAVQDDLRLSENQRTSVAKRAEGILQYWEKQADELRQHGNKDRRKLAPELGQQCDQAVAEILTPAQARRLRQIAYQQMGIRAFSHAAVIEAIGLSRAQRQDLIHRFELERMRREGELWKVTPVTSSLEEVQKKILEQRRLTMEQALQALTTEQRARWKEITGEPFQGDIRLLVGGKYRFPL
jgi:eukaryotic-like serine/threonine-protein kinase